jgi:uncharacterized phosphosugar-binding protein
MNVIETYINKCRDIAGVVEAQQDIIQKVSAIFAKTIAAGRMVHAFGSGHSRIMVEEMWPRYGSYPGFNPIVELSLTYHNNVVGANGQRQAMFLENVPGLAGRILRNFDVQGNDAALIVSSSGSNIVPIEMAELFQQKNIPVVSIITKLHSAGSASKRPDGKMLGDFSDYILDTGAPLGDAMVNIKGLDTPVSPGSTIGGIMIINCIKAEVARLLTNAGKPPKVLSSAAVVGSEKAAELFESAYDEHAHRLAKLYQKLGYPSYVSGE